MDEIDLHAWVIGLGEAQGGEFDYGTMTFREPKTTE